MRARARPSPMRSRRPTSKSTMSDRTSAGSWDSHSCLPLLRPFGVSALVCDHCEWQRCFSRRHTNQHHPSVNFYRFGYTKPSFLHVPLALILSTSSRYDLLEPDNANLSIREDTKKGVYCENLHELPVASGACGADESIIATTISIIKNIYI